MFDWLKNKFGGKQLEDPVFGKLLFIKLRSPKTSYWEGRGYFEPTRGSIEYSIEADDDGPSPSQYALYYRIKENYPQLFRMIEPLLESELAAFCGDVPDAKPVFHLEGLSVPPVESESMEWDMDFSCSAGDDWLLTVHMLGWKPSGKVSVMH